MSNTSELASQLALRLVEHFVEGAPCPDSITAYVFTLGEITALRNSLPAEDADFASADGAEIYRQEVIERLHVVCNELESHLRPENHEGGIAALPPVPDQYVVTLQWAALRLAEPKPETPPAPNSVGGKAVEGNASSPPKDRKKKKLRWLAEAMLLKQDHPYSPDAEIARQVGVDKAQLSRSEEYQAAARRAIERARTRTGHKTADGVEAYADDKHPDRGQPIAGSDLYREYCADCDEPIRVPKRELDTGAKCHDCQ